MDSKLHHSITSGMEISEGVIIAPDGPSDTSELVGKGDSDLIVTAGLFDFECPGLNGTVGCSRLFSA